MIDKEFLSREAENAGILLTDKMLEQFDVYCKLLLDWNQRVNLTAIREPEGVAVRHFLDSILLLRFHSFPENARVIDVGTGAGFPGVPLKITRPDFNLTLLDSLNKRLVFLEEVGRQLNQKNKVIHSRAEEGGKLSELREQFDIAVSRAVASLNLLAEYCLPYVKVGGFFLAAKGPDIKNELECAEKAIDCLGGEVAGVENYSLPDGSGRSLVIVRKRKETPAQYPRHGSKISKKPL